MGILLLIHSTGFVVRVRLKGLGRLQAAGSLVLGPLVGMSFDSGQFGLSHSSVLSCAICSPAYTVPMNSAWHC